MTDTTSETKQKNESSGKRNNLVERIEHNHAASIMWAVILLWGAAVLAVDMTGLSHNHWWDAGGIFLIGAGTVLLADAAYRVIKAEYQRRILLRFIFGVISLGAGIDSLVSMPGNFFMIVILLLIAGGLLINVFLRTKTA